MKKWIIGISIPAVLLVGLILGIGVKKIMDKQAELQAVEKQFFKNLEQSKKEATEILKWNYENIERVTFEYPTPDDGAYLVKLDKSLTTTPLGGLDLNGYVNNDKKLSFSWQLQVWQPDEEIGLPGDTPLTSGDKLDDSLLKIREEVLWKKEPSYDLLLMTEDIRKLKELGFTKKITADEIIRYWEGK